MPNTLESIPTVLGKIRKGLIEAGYSQDQAFQITVDLIRRCESPQELRDY